MLAEELQKLSSKQSLDGSDAFAVLQMLQDHTTPILSRRCVGSSPAVHSRLSSSSKPAKPSSHEGRTRSFEEGEKRRDGEGGTARGLGRGLVECNTSRDGSLKRALFDERVSPGARAVGTAAGSGVSARASIPNVDSLQDFPPIQPATTTATRKKDKRTSKPRRITLTSLQQQHHHPHTSHFTPTPLTSDKWSPASVVEVAVSGGPSALSEERRLLMNERSKHMKRKSGSRNGATNYSGMTGATPDRSIARPRYSGSPSLTTSEHQLRDRSLLSESPQQSTGGVCSPLTSTPVADPQATRTALSIDRVSDREMLDNLAQLYARMITDLMVPNLTSEIHFVVQLLTCTTHIHPSQSLSGTDQCLFSTVENCVYFAVRVLYSIRSMLTALDKATLELLCGNVRIKQLEPQLAVFLSGVLEAASKGSSRPRPLAQSAFSRVPFQEETDNVKNFPNMKVFHAFKKQRDLFYSILRQWETDHNTPGWSYQTALRDNIRSLVSQPTELSSLDHFATLFQKQLLESCGYATHISAGVSELVEGPLKNLNPDKLMRLSERFLRQSHVITGTSPPPAFTESEQFFSNFIITADSYIFNHHLCTVLSHELLKLHSRCESVAVKDVPEILHTLRVLAKFLGHLDFLPYSSILSPSLLPARTASPHIAMIFKCVQGATERGHLSLTIPWVVDYMSTMDSRALQVTQYHTLLCRLITVYRSSLVETEGVTVDTFLVMTTLGWLFEIPNMPNSIFFEYLRTTPLPSSPSHPSTQRKLVTRELLYTCCPYLAGVRVLLAEFAAGLQSKTSPIRKIKPIPAGSTPLPTHTTLSSQLQVKLRDNFFRNHPPVLKQLCGTVSDRVAETAIQLVQSQIIPEHSRRELRVLASWLGKTSLDHRNADSSIIIDELFRKYEAVQHVAEVSERTFSSVLTAATQFCRQHSETNTRTALNSLLCGTISKQVMEVTVGIATDWSMDHCMKWLHDKLRGIVFQEVSSGFDRLRKAVRDGGRSHLSTTSLHVGGGCCLNSSRVETLLSSQHSLSLCESYRHHVPFSTGSTSLFSPFMELASSILSDISSPSRDKVLSITRVTADVKDVISAEVMVVEGGYSPLLLPPDTDTLLSTSVQLATLLVSHGLTHTSCDCDNKVLVVFVEQITSFWSLLKGLKQEIPIHILLCADSVTRYLQHEQQGVEGVWHSLTGLLIETIKLSVVATDVLEALWLCRIRQSPIHQRQGVVDGAAVFLATWFEQGQGEKDEANGMFREVCFVRLLSLVVRESETASVAVFKSHPSLPFLSL